MQRHALEPPQLVASIAQTIAMSVFVIPNSLHRYSFRHRNTMFWLLSEEVLQTTPMP